MLKLLKIFFYTLFIAATVAALGFTEDGDKKAIKWYEFSKAIEKGKAENKMIVVDFYTDWCSACKLMDKNTYGNSEVISYAGKKLIMTKVNAESNEKTTFRGKQYSYRQLALGFGVRAYPTTIFITPEGEFLTDIKGYIPAEKFIPILEFLEGKHYEKMKFEEYLAKREAN